MVVYIIVSMMDGQTNIRFHFKFRTVHIVYQFGWNHSFRKKGFSENFYLWTFVCRVPSVKTVLLHNFSRFRRILTLSRKAPNSFAIPIRLSACISSALTGRIFVEVGKTGNPLLSVCVDAFCKFVWLLLVLNASTDANTDALKQKIFATFPVPEVMVSDNAKCIVFDWIQKGYFY